MGEGRRLFFSFPFFYFPSFFFLTFWKGCSFSFFFFNKLPEISIVYKFLHCVLFICQEKSCTIPTYVSKTNGSFHNTTQCVCIFTWVSQPCSWRRDSATFAHVLFSFVCKLWPPKQAPNEPTGCGLVGGRHFTKPRLDRVLLESLQQIGCFQGVWAHFNIWVNYE